MRHNDTHRRHFGLAPRETRSSDWSGTTEPYAPGAGQPWAKGNAMWDLFPAFSSEIKGAISGGVIAAILDRGSISRRLTNGIGSVLFALIATRGLVDLLNLPSTDNVISLISAVLAIVGIIVAESLQRLFRRMALRIEGNAEKIADRYTGKIDGDKGGEK
jgi:hypothetical protein